MRTRAENIVEKLRDSILQGTYPAGHHLQEAPLCTEMHVSRTPVRAALAALAAEGLLDYVAKRGYTVRGFSLKEVAATYEIRANLEGMACRLAAERGLSAEIARKIENTLTWGDAILGQGRLKDEDRDDWMEMNNRFHQQLLDAAGNRLLNDLVERTYRIPMVSSRVVHWYDFQAVKGSHDLHHRIFRYVSDGQDVNAEGAMREHVLQAIDQIRYRVPVAGGADNIVILNAKPQTAGGRFAG